MVIRLFGALLLLLVFFAALAIVAVKYGGLAGLAGVLLLFLVAALLLRFLLKRLLERLFTAPFRIKGAVLKDAAVQIHAVTRDLSPAPEQPENDESPAAESGDGEARQEERVYYWLDVTITPTETTGAFTLWEPGELLLVRPDARPEVLEGAESECGFVEEIEIWHDGAWQPDEGGKYAGPQRVRLQVTTPAGMRQARFRYYFELFGAVELPPGDEPASAAAGSPS